MKAAAGRLPGIGTAPWGFSWPLLIAGAVFGLLLNNPALLNDPDTYWHVRVGQWIVQHFAIPTADIYSHTMKGAPWTAHEWLAEVLFAIAFDKGGWAGLAILAAAAVATALAALTRYLLRYLKPVYAIMLTVLAATMVAPHLLARPHILVIPLLVIWGIGLVDAREAERSPALWLSLLMVLWTNLHGSFVFGLALIIPFAFDAVLQSKREARWRTARQWGLFFAVSLGASLINPLGPKAILFSFEVDSLGFALSRITEWRSPDFQKLQPLEVFLLLAGAVTLSRGLKLPWLRIALLLLLLHLALKHTRHADLLALLAPILVAKPMANQGFGNRGLAQSSSVLDRAFNALAPRALPATIALVILLLGASSLLAIRSDTLRPAAIITPEAALRALQAHGTTGPGLNSYDFGGYLIFVGTPTFIDGRAVPFGDRFLQDYSNALMLAAPDALSTLLERYDVRWTMLQPGTPAIALLERLPGWIRLYEDRIAVVHVRER